MPNYDYISTAQQEDIQIHTNLYSRPGYTPPQPLPRPYSLAALFGQGTQLKRIQAVISARKTDNQVRSDKQAANRRGGIHVPNHVSYIHVYIVVLKGKGRCDH